MPAGCPTFRGAMRNAPESWLQLIAVRWRLLLHQHVCWLSYMQCCAKVRAYGVRCCSRCRPLCRQRAERADFEL